MTLLPHTPRDITPADARRLLRSLRDLNLASHLVALGGGESISIDGCLSIDSPVEQGVRYRLRTAAGDPLVLELHWEGEEMEILVRGCDGDDRSLCATFRRDARGRVSSRDLAARLHLEEHGGRQLEHFLRRVVRGVLSAA